jgi:hypothetical protein
VVLAVVTGNGFNRFPAGLEAKPLKRLGCGIAENTGLKPGANERLQTNCDASEKFEGVLMFGHCCG